MMKWLLVFGVLLAQGVPAEVLAQDGQNQGEASGKESSEEGGESGQEEESPSPFNMNFIWVMVVIFALFYIIIILPDRRKRAGLQKQLSELKINDRVVTIGGILGTVTRVNKETEEVTLTLDESNNTRMRVIRSAIRQILTDEEPEKKAQ